MTVSNGWYSPTTVGVCNPKASAVWFALVLLSRFVELRPVKAQNYWRLSFGFICDSLQITLCAVNNGAFAMPLAITTPRDSMDLPPTPHFAGPTGAASDRRARPLGFMATMAGRGGRTAMMGFKVRLATAANEVFGSTKLTFQKPLPIRRSSMKAKPARFRRLRGMCSKPMAHCVEVCVYHCSERQKRRSWSHNGRKSPGNLGS